MTRTEQQTAACQAAHARLFRLLATVTDDLTPAPSLLPGWSVGHVLTHLARNAEAMVTRIEAARQGEIVEQYVGGASGREHQIEIGARRSAAEIVADVKQWSTRLDELFAELADDTWDLPVRTVGGTDHPIRDLPFRRWREVEVHLVDLDLGVTSADWPDELLAAVLPRLLARLPDRTDHRGLAAWLLGRGPAPTLDPWA